MICKRCRNQVIFNDDGLCKICWQVEHYLEDYLKSRGGRAYVQLAWIEAELEYGEGSA